MSDKTDLESRVVAAIRHYRKALTRVENLEQEDACAHQGLTSTLVDLGRVMQNEAAPHLKDTLFEIGSAAVSQADKSWAALVEATAKLESARLTLAALEQQLGYIPEISMGADNEQTD